MNTFLITDFLNTRNLTINICEPLETEDYVVQTLFDVSPIKWHLGHTTWFFESFILKKFMNNYSEFDPMFNFIFNSYYNTLGERITKDTRGLLSRPTVNQIKKYREHIDANIIHLLTNSEATDELLKLLSIGINHEQQHQELMIYDIKHILFSNPTEPRYHDIIDHDYQNIDNKYIMFEECVSNIGITDKINFSFDNESPQHKVLLNPFQIRNTLVTNGEFLAFINDNGYSNHQHWLDDAWYIIKNENLKHPIYWKNIDNMWYEWTFSGFEKLKMNKPISHVSFYEADAFASWCNKRLPTEYEWEHVAKLYAHDIGEFGFFESKLLDIHSVNENNQKFHHLVGNVWQWTSSAYLPYHGYKKPQGAVGEYNAKFMSGQMILKGGSYATSKSHYRHTYRNFFQPEKRWLISGIRLAESL